MPTHNRVRFLREAVRSVLSQSLRNISVVVLDNASDEDVQGAMDAFGDPRLSVVRQPVNIGSLPNVNAALGLGDTPYLVVFHDDDTMHPEMLEHELRIMERNPQMAFVATGYRAVTDPIEMSRFTSLEATAVDVFADERELLRFLMAQGTLHFGSAMYRREAVRDVRLDVERFGRFADRPFLPAVARGRPSACIRGPWVNYRIHVGQQSNLGPLQERQVRALLRAYRDALEPSWDAPTRRLFYRFASNVLLDTYGALPRAVRPPLLAAIAGGMREGVLHPLFIRRPGAVALARVVVDSAWSRVHRMVNRMRNPVN